MHSVKNADYVVNVGLWLTNHGVEILHDLGSGSETQLQSNKRS